MLRFNTIQDFIDYRKDCILCGDPLSVMLSSNLYMREIREDFRSIHNKNQNKISYQFQEGFKWEELFSVDTTTNIITTTGSPKDLQNLFISAKFCIYKSCLNSDFCGGVKVHSYDLAYDIKNNKIFHPLLWKDKVIIRSSQGKRKQTVVISNYKDNTTQILVYNIELKKPDFKTLIINKFENQINPYNVMPDRDVKVFSHKIDLPLIEINKIESREKLLNKIDTLMMFA